MIFVVNDIICKKRVLGNPQNSQENIRAKVSLLIKRQTLGL